ncbi:hypothetical protein J7M23_05630 [Candidatus Sumerlaeota bacterium]|nr:hypothetical protein [Candidatus Sumerlaeota bacterium]
MKECIAEIKLFSLTPTGERQPLRIAIGKPYKIDATSWGCPVALDGLYKNLHDAVGVDSWQSLNLAIALLQNLLKNYLKDGKKLFREEGGKEVFIEDLFPQFKEQI